MNPLKELHRFGVSVWYDNISRDLLRSGALKRLIDDGARGVTSNPTIFEKAIGSSTDYDDAIRRHARACRTPAQLFEKLAVADIRDAADLFRGVYEDSNARDGYVSIELPPELAQDAEASHQEALRLHALVGRPNVMIKIPGTAAALPAIEATLADGVPVNVTLLFSQERYAEVAQAALRGLERRAQAGKPLAPVASVASFFVSRVDSAVDKSLAGLGPQAKDLMGKAAIANAKLAYQTYKKVFSSARFRALEALGAQPQRLLWASTGAKNPSYKDTLYVEELIGPETVNTMPPATVDAFRAHGVCRPSLEEDVAGAREAWARLGSLVDLAATARTLEDEGLRAFAKSYETLMGQLKAKRELVLAEAGVLARGLSELKSAGFAERLWRKDPSLWKKEKEHQKIIKNSLGWLSVADAMAANMGTLRGFSAEVREAGFETAVVLGMGGSSLACEVFRLCFERAPGHPALAVLDTTHPGAIKALESRLDLARTLFIVSSKSGSTIEPNCLMEYFFDKTGRLGRPADAGRRFVAITDPGTSLEKLARARGFRRVFVNPQDIGGRYSALSYFGLVPAAALGVDVEKLLTRARAMARACSPAVPSEENPGLRLGAALGCHARNGQDKLTLSLSPALESFGLWAAQLVAESTGKEGVGIVPVLGEPLGAPAADVYGEDRLFVRLSLPDSPDREAARSLGELERAGRPVLALELADAYDLGGQFLLWEIATAAAGFLLGVNPFDQPDVQAAKDQTMKLLGELEKGALPREAAHFRAGGLAAFSDPGLLKSLGAGRGSDLPVRDVLAAHLGRLEPGDHCAILAYLDGGDEAARLAVAALRSLIRKTTTCPVLVEYGPRYLHSTGQLYKGGGAGGVYLVLTEPPAADLPVPRSPFTFGTLLSAQARGDFSALVKAGRRVLRLELGPAGAGSLQALANALTEPANA